MKKMSDLAKTVSLSEAKVRSLSEAKARSLSEAKARSLCDDTSRFTPLYVIKMFLDALHFQNKNIIIPEALLECGNDFEENLRQDLKEIGVIADSNNRENLVKYVTEPYLLTNIFYIFRRYSELVRILFGSRNCLSKDHKTLEDFMREVNFPTIINRDVVKDMMPVSSHIICGRYYWKRIFCCIFRYILYTKTKHLGLFEQTTIDFRLGTTDQDFVVFDY